MEARAKDECCGNVVLFPMMAQGHINPFIDLAHLLHSRHPNLILTIVSTSANVANLRPLFASNPSVQLLELHFRSSDHGLPPDIEHTLNLSRSGISRLYNASQALQPSFHRLISALLSRSDGTPLLSIVSDMFLAWSVEVAAAFGIHHAVLYTSGPYAMSIYNSIWTNLPHANTDADEIPVPGLAGLTVQRSQLSNLMKAAGATGPDHASATFARRQAEYCRRSDCGLWNTVAVLERKSLEDWEKSTGQPTLPIGPLHRARAAAAGGPVPGLPAQACVAWLDRQPSRSVVYVSFGSQSSIGRRQMAELAKGLEASGRPFVWAVRPPIGSDAGAPEEEWDLGLPDGFEDRIGDRGLLIRRWAPQLEILRHPAAGAFLSHCGWNSMLESLESGVPVIGWPLASEQFYNAKLLDEELGVLVEMARGEEQMIEEGDVVRVLEEVFVGERGREMRKRVEDLKEEMRRAVEEDRDGNGEEKGSSILALDEFVATVMMRRSGPSA